MFMMIVSAVCLLALVGMLVWFLTPTVKTFGGPDFEPVPKDPESVELAVHAAAVTSGGAGL
jgi:hypothetical protein